MKLHRLRRTHPLQQPVIAIVVVLALTITIPPPRRPRRALAAFPRRQPAREHAHAWRARRPPPFRRVEDLAVQLRGGDGRAGHGARAVSVSVGSIGFRGRLRREVGPVWKPGLGGVRRGLQAVVLVENAVQEQVLALLGRGSEGGCGRGEGRGGRGQGCVWEGLLAGCGGEFGGDG